MGFFKGCSGVSLGMSWSGVEIVLGLFQDRSGIVLRSNGVVLDSFWPPATSQ